MHVCVADGYLSDDERAVHRGSDDEDGFESICATAIAPVGKEKFLHSVLNESVTSYLNALLNAKNNNQVVVMASNPGKGPYIAATLARVISSFRFCMQCT